MFSLHSVWQQFPNLPCPDVSAAGSYLWLMAQRVWCGWHLRVGICLTCALRHQLDSKHSRSTAKFACQQASHETFDFLLFAHLAVSTVVSPWITGSPYLLQSLFGHSHGSQMSNNPNFLFSYFFLFHGNRTSFSAKGHILEFSSGFSKEDGCVDGALRSIDYSFLCIK